MFALCCRANFFQYFLQIFPDLFGGRARIAVFKGKLTDMCEHGDLFIWSVEWTVAAIGSIALLATLSISLKGAAFFAKFNIMFFIIHQGATLWGTPAAARPRSRPLFSIKSSRGLDRRLCPVALTPRRSYVTWPVPSTWSDSNIGSNYDP